MDVEQIQKINNLALELMKQGLVQSRDEAVYQAESIFKRKETGGYSEIRETLNKVETAKVPSKIDEKTELSQEKIQEIMEKNTTFLVKTIKDFQEKIIFLEKEIDQLKNKINYHKLPTVRDFVANKSDSQPYIENASGVPPVIEEPIRREEKKPSSSHPRYGDYKENDVSIEKFFYMGSK